MTDRDKFMRAICAQPENDNVRLVFADWLEEHGDIILGPDGRPVPHVARRHI